MLLKPILLVHRYLGVALGILMTLWCLSGFVMMYQSYPSTTDEEHRRALPGLDFDGCCALSESQLDALANAGSFRIEMFDARPVMQTGGGFRPQPEIGLNGNRIDLNQGVAAGPARPDQLRQLAIDFARGNGIAGEPTLVEGPVEMDQWTVQTARRNAPVYKMSFNDPAATVLYASGSSGRIFQDTSRRERVLTWLGAIPHWLYPLQLRRNGPLWSQIVIWGSLIGSFLTATGLYVGISRLRRRPRDGKLVSPFRGWWYWHHILGLFFGVLVLTWVFSGLLTMTPWGWLAGGSESFRYRTALTGDADPEQVRRFLSGLGNFQGDTYVRLESTRFDGDFFVLATTRDGREVMFDTTGQPVALSSEQIEAALDDMSRELGVPIRDFRLLDSEDSYYYAYKGGEVPLPVFRATLDDEQRTRLYINPANATVNVLDANERLNRWTRVGMHRLDFSFMKARPLWDVLVIILLLGVTAVCITGTWMSVRRVKLDCRLLRKKWQRVKARPTD